MSDASCQVERPDTWELLNEEGRHLLDSQRSATERIETKSALVVGAALTAAQFVAGREVESYWLPIGVGFYIAAIAAGLVTLLPRTFDNIGLERLLRGTWWMPRGHAAAEIVNNRNVAIQANHKRHQRRLVWFWVSLTTLAAGAIMSVAHVTWGEDVNEQRLNGTCAESWVRGTFICTADP